MDELSRSRLVARRVLSWWFEAAAADTPVATPAVAIDALVERLELEVTTFHPAARRGGTLGWLEPGENLIFLRDDLPEPVRRFTLAHELGHALLHRTTGLPAPVSALLAADLPPSTDPDTEGDLEPEAGPAPACDDVDLDAPMDALSLGDEALRPGQAYSARARRESEANAFAAALLLPAAPLRALFLGDGQAHGLSPRELAERFGVSEETVHQALAGLLLPGAAEASAAPAVTRLGGSSARPALDRWQRAAAAAQAPALIVAGPGTGKTSTLVGRVAHLVFNQGVDPWRILALTFSNKASQEMRERLEALLAESPGASSPSAPSAARPTVSTIHAFCGDVLRRYGPLVGLRSDYRLISEVEGYLLLREVAGGLVLPYFQPLAAPAMHFPALLSSISRAKDELADPIQYAVLAERMAQQAHMPEERTAAARAREVARVYAAYQRALSEAGNADFGDLIRLAVRVLQEHPEALAELRERHPHILVDEFQDINRAMGVLLRVLAGPDGQIWAVGDADQAIYRFRGASPANLARFTEAYPSARIYPLATNYRSRPPILRAAHAIASALLDEGERAVLEAAYQSAAPPADSNAQETVVTLASAPDEAAELAGIAATIREHVARGYALADQAVLCRTRRQCQRVADALDAAGFPARVVTPLLEQPDVKNVLSVVLLLADVSGSGLLRAGSIEDHPFSRDETLAVLRCAQERHVPPATLLLGGSRLDEVEGLTPEGRAGLTRLGDILGRLWAAPDVATGLAQYVFSLTGLGHRALSDPTAAGRVRAATLARLLALARAFEDQRRAAAPARAHAEAREAHWDEFIDYVRVLSALGREAAASDDVLSVASDGVRVLTVHGSKGLEFPIVYLPNLADGRFPTQRRGEVAPAPPGLSEDAALAARDAAAHLAEEACLFYVAITRARDALVISYAERYGKRRASPSPFLKPLMPLAADPRSGVARVRWPAMPEITRAVHAADDAAAPAVSRSFQGADRPPMPQAADDLAATRALQGRDANRPGGMLPSPQPPEPEPVVSPDEPLRVGAIETYQRCPRQYAYRYVYRLRPREVGLGTLRRSLHETLRELQARIASEANALGVPTREAGFPTLAEARELFEQRWREAVAAEAEARRRGEPADEVSARVLDGPFGTLYRRHGQRVIERAWLDLLRERGLPLPDGMESPPLWRDDPAGGAEGASPGADVRMDTEAGMGERHAAPVPLGARLEERVLVRVGGRTIEVTLDRVEGEAQAGERRPGGPRAPVVPDAAPCDAQPADALPVPVSAPVRFVRHRLGRSAPAQATPADLRALLYAMAAEQERRASPAELYQHNLTTGELERVQLDPRRQARLRETLIETLAGIESGAYPARPDPLTCQSCPFLLICPA